MKHFNKSHTVVAMAATLFLAACGGGGDSTGSSDGSVSTPTSNSVPLQSVASIPTYPAGSDRLNAFNYINAERVKCGFGALNQNAMLDAAMQNHVNFGAVNRQWMINSPHDESISLPGFTGVTASDRAIKVGYPSSGGGSSDILVGVDSWFNLNFNSGNPVLTAFEYNSARTLMGVPYHAMHMFSPAVDVGLASNVSVTTTTDNAQISYGWAGVQLGFGTTANGQQPVANTGVRTYPCDGITSANPALFGEWTGGAPVVSRDLGNNPTGTPIIVAGEIGKSFSIVSAQITQLSDGQQIPALALRTKANDPNPQLYFYDWMGYVLPDTGFKQNEYYKVDLVVSIGGILQSKAFTFRTGGYSPDVLGAEPTK